MKKEWNKQYLWLLVLLTILGIAFRFWRLAVPNEIVFDETYYAKWGQDYFQGQSFFDVHPPLGKLLIGLGVWVTGSDPEAGAGAFGWRLMVALFGIFVVPLTYDLTKKLFNSQRTALLAALFVLLDGLLLVQSRTALLDSFLVTFSLASYWAFINYWQAKTPPSRQLWLAITGFFLGLSLATKWTAVAPLLVIWLLYLGWHGLKRLSWHLSILYLFIIPIGVYLLSFIFNQHETGFWPYLIDWHVQTWNFHHHLTASHPYQSRWYTWLYLARPVWYYFKSENNLITGVLALGNPILWWASLPALVATIWLVLRRQAPLLMIPLAAFSATYLPWSIIGRTEFQYYLVGGVPFMLIILAWWLNYWLDHKYLKIAAWVIILSTIAAFIFFYPLWTAYPISSSYYQHHIWFKSWI